MLSGTPTRRSATKSWVVLVVDSEPALHGITRRWLEGSGIQVRAACSASDALALVQSAATVDLVLCDLMLPGMGGVELIERLRALGLPLAVVVTSGIPSGLAPERLSALRVDAFLPKPFRAPQLLDTVRRVLQASVPVS